MDDSRLRVELAEVFLLEQAAKAHELEQGHTRGKLVFDTTA